MNKFKFKFNQRVRIKDGFYAGQIGTIAGFKLVKEYKWNPFSEKIIHYKLEIGEFVYIYLKDVRIELVGETK